MDNKTALRYVYFYLSVVYFLSIYSYVLDYIFYKIDYSSFKDYRDSVVWYIVSFGIARVHILIPIIIFYNYAINNFFPDNKYVRLLCGLFMGLLIGFLFRECGIGLSIYIGKWCSLKQILVFILTGVSVELLRILVVKLRYKDKKVQASIE